MVNMTNGTGLNSSLTVHLNQSAQIVQEHPHQVGVIHHEAYAIGKALREVFDYLAWQIWSQETSSEEWAKSKQLTVYRQGLKECVKKLKPALEHLHKNPLDSGSLAKIISLASHYNAYLKPNENADWRELQQKSFKPLVEKIALISQAGGSFASLTPSSTSSKTPSLTNSVSSSTSPDSTIPIAVGVTASLVVIAGIVGTVVFLRLKHKACFADQARKRATTVQSVTEKIFG